MSAGKPIVQYVDAVPGVRVGDRARLLLKGTKPITGWVITSKVQRIENKPNGPLLETMNTIYIPPTTDESLPHSDAISRLEPRSEASSRSLAKS